MRCSLSFSISLQQFNYPTNACGVVRSRRSSDLSGSFYDDVIHLQFDVRSVCQLLYGYIHQTAQHLIMVVLLLNGIRNHLVDPLSILSSDHQLTHLFGHDIDIDAPVRVYVCSILCGVWSCVGDHLSTSHTRYCVYQLPP